MAYLFYLDGVILPITPTKLSVSIKNQNKTIELINDGQINILKMPGLTQINFEFVVPVNKYPFVCDLQPPEYYLSLLENLKTNLQPFQFAINRNLPNGQTSFKTNMTVSLESYEIVEDASNGSDITFQIELKQYKPYGTQIFNVSLNEDGSATATKSNARTTNKIIAKTYKVKSGDTLWNIAKKQLGDGSLYKKLAIINDIANPNILTVGQLIKLS